MTPLNFFIVVMALLVSAVIFAAVRRRSGRGRTPPGNYRLRKDALFSRGELAFLSVLEASLPRGVRLFGKVRLADIFTLSDQVPKEEHMRARGRINQKHVDFLLVRSDDLTPLAGVELDDRTHESSDRRERDAFVDTVFAGGGLPLVHVTAQSRYDRSAIREQIAAALR